MKAILIATGLTLFASSVFAEDNLQPQPTAAQTVQIGPARMQAASQGQNTRAIVQFNNTDSTGHIVIAAVSPVASQIKIRTYVRVNNRPVSVQIHSIALQTSRRTGMSYRGKYFQLMDLKHSLRAGQKIPVTIAFRDGSYDTVQARVS